MSDKDGAQMENLTILTGKALRERRRGRNIALLAVLSFLIGTIFVVTIVKTQIAEERQHFISD